MVARDCPLGETTGKERKLKEAYQIRYGNVYNLII